MFLSKRNKFEKDLTYTNTPNQSGPGSDGNERVHHTHQISRTGSSPLDVA